MVSNKLSCVGCHGSTSNITDPDADIAAFLATRGGALCNSLCLAAIWNLIVLMTQGTLGSATVGAGAPKFMSVQPRWTSTTVSYR